MQVIGGNQICDFTIYINVRSYNIQLKGMSLSVYLSSSRAISRSQEIKVVFLLIFAAVRTSYHNSTFFLPRWICSGKGTSMASIGFLLNRGMARADQDYLIKVYYSMWSPSWVLYQRKNEIAKASDQYRLNNFCFFALDPQVLLAAIPAMVTIPPRPHGMF